MRKILKLLGMLTLSSCAVSPILACSNQTLDGTLKIISGVETSYEAWDLNIGINKPVDVPTKDHVTIATQEIISDNLVVLAQTLAQKIVNKTGSSDIIPWFNSNLSEGAKCYNFSIDNGKTDSTTGNKMWYVNDTTAQIAVDITYQVGAVTNNKTFQNYQQVKDTFNLKCDYTRSDYMVYTTVDSIAKIAKNTLEIIIDEKNKPKIGANFIDLGTNLQDLIQTELVKKTKFNNPHINSVATIQKGIDGQVVSNTFTIYITFNVQFQDSFIDMAKPSPYDGSDYHYTLIEFITGS